VAHLLQHGSWIYWWKHSSTFYVRKRFLSRLRRRKARYPERAMNRPDADAVFRAAPMMLQVALEEARIGLAEGGLPIGAAIFDAHGKLAGRGHNRRVQLGDPSLHGETDAFRNAGRQKSYRRAGTARGWCGSLGFARW
jgi:hypothetical protein